MAQKYDKKTKKWYYYGSYVKHGKRIQYKKRGFTTERKARIAEEDFRARIEQEQDKILFNELIDKYEQFTYGRIKESSYDKHQSILKKWRSRFGDIFVQDLDEDEIQEFVNELDDKYSKRYVEKIFYTANSVFKYGIKKKLIKLNPLDFVERNARPNEQEKEMLFWEPEEFNGFIKYVDDPLWNTMFSTLFYMGIRKGEAFALQWKDIDFKAKTMKIYKTSGQKQRARKVKYTTPKTDNSYRTITMPNALMEKLTNWNNIEKNFYGYSQDSFVFGNDLPIPAETLRRNFDRYIDLANEKIKENALNDVSFEEPIQRIRVHDLRHSHASYLINNKSVGFTDFDIAKRLGDTVETLHKTYAHWFKKKDSKIVEFMNSDICEQ